MEAFEDGSCATSELRPSPSISGVKIPVHLEPSPGILYRFCQHHSKGPSKLVLIIPRSMSSNRGWL
jgi:hypothetical protein